MTDKPKPWSVKGISPEGRQLARQAAQAAGMPIGRWLDTVIHQQAGAPIILDKHSPSRAEDSIQAVVNKLSGKIDDMTLRLALVQTGRGLPAEDIAQLERLRIGGTFEYAGEDIDPVPVIAAQAQTERARRPRRGWRLGLIAVLLLIGASSSYIAISGAVTVPPTGLTSFISQINASVAPALRDLGFAGPAPAQKAIADAGEIPNAPLSRISLRDRRPVPGMDSRAQDGDIAAQYQLARAYADGHSRPRNDAKAAHWLTQAANQGHVQAIYELATAYQDGRGVPASAAKAAAWYHRAAEKDHRSAQYALGLAYAEGDGVTRDYTKATAWLERAATANRADAQFALGLLHERGFATEASIESAHRWYKAAAANGFPQATKRAADLVERHGSIPSSPPRPVRDSAAVTEIQQLLTDLGFDPGPVDGRIGKKTNAAIRLYQATLGLKIDGRPTDHLLTHLRTVTGTDIASSS